MRVWQLFILVLIVAVVGVFVAPPYQYTYEESLLLKKKPSSADYLLWPIRAYENWKTCGDVHYCRAVRCAALEGGCPDLGSDGPLLPNSDMLPTTFPGRDPAMADVAWRRTVESWCTASATQSDGIAKARQECKARRDSPSEVPGDVKLDISNLRSGAPAIAFEPLICGDMAKYEQHCG